jgi:tRNA(Ile)-lysidine synthase
MLLSKIKQTVRTYRMLSPGDRVVVAVSGGPDSVCLLRSLLALAPELGLGLHVAHLDHRFRGSESAAEAEFVRALAKKLGLPATIESIDVPAYCAGRGLSAQAGAREVRYGFLQEAAAAFGAGRIALGHTANDQAETLLMRLIRGAGVTGLSSIPPVRENIIRPLIECTRDEVLASLKEWGQDFVTDQSNTKPVYTRNRVRLEVIPALERLNPRVVEALAADADILREEDAAMEAALAPAAADILRFDGEAVTLAREGFNSLLPALRRRLLRRALALCGGDDADGLSSVQTSEALAFMADAQTGRTMELPGGLALAREYDSLVIGRRPAEHTFCVEIAVPGETAVTAADIVAATTVREPASAALSENENNLWQAQFDYDKIALPLYLRSRRAGDRFRPAGMESGKKKLQDFFTDEKVPQRQRGSIPVLATKDDVLWVLGMRTDGRFLLGPETKKVLVVRVRKAR